MIDGKRRPGWRGPLYINAEDSAIWVRKRTGLGWTLNFGQPVSWLVLMAIIAVPIAVAVLVVRAR